jgi:hypothetical protein
MRATMLKTRARRTWRVLRILPLVLVTASTPLISACGDSTGPGCCKVCKQGKACGDTCINKTDICTKGVGCACDG